MVTQQIVFVVDDDESIRDSIRMLLDSVGLASATYDGAKAFLDTHLDAYSPEMSGCLVLDIRMPGMSGLELQEQLLRLGFTLPIIFITGHGDVPMAVEAMKRGAADFIRKPFREQELLTCIDNAMQLDKSRAEKADEVGRAKSLVALLTPREREVFQRVAAGQANKVVAIELGVSERTVEIHRSNAMHKTQSRSLADLVRLQLMLEQDKAAS